MHSTLQLVFLGTGGSWPSRDRNVPSVALQYGPQVILFDCGEGTQRQLMYTSVSFMRIGTILISHYHGDHFLGLPGLLQSMCLNDRTTPLEIAGPAGTIPIVRSILNLGYFNATFKITLRELNAGDTIEERNYQLRTAVVDHDVPTLAYAFIEAPRPGRFNKPRALELGIPPGPLYAQLQRGQTIEVDGKTITPEMVLGPPRPGRKIVYSGDTRPTDAMVELADGADVLIHDATSDASIEGKINRYGHTTAEQAAGIAAKAGVRHLFLTHISPRYRDTSSLVDEATAVFENSTVAADLMAYDVRHRPNPGILHPPPAIGVSERDTEDDELNT